MYAYRELARPPVTERKAQTPTAVRPEERGLVLVVDDAALNRDTLARQLKLQGHVAATAADGAAALQELRSRTFDMVLIDVMMPGMDGYTLLRHIRADPDLCHLPVVVVSGVDTMESITRCVELGADDYLLKPCDPILLRARVGACLEKKRLRDREQEYLRQLRAEQQQCERLIHAMLPPAVARQLRQHTFPIADQYDDVTVMFADLVGFTNMAATMRPTALVGLLNDIFSRFDRLTAWHGLEKIKTIGDAYMVVGGLSPHPDAAGAVTDLAFALIDDLAAFNRERGCAMEVRVGLSSGPAIAGVIGTSRYTYDLWGDTVNTANRMQALSAPGRVLVSAATRDRLPARYSTMPCLPMQVKGKGEMETFFVQR